MNMYDYARRSMPRTSVILALFGIVTLVLSLLPMSGTPAPVAPQTAFAQQDNAVFFNDGWSCRARRVEINSVGMAAGENNTSVTEASIPSATLPNFSNVGASDIPAGSWTYVQTLGGVAGKDETIPLPEFVEVSLNGATETVTAPTQTVTNVTPYGGLGYLYATSFGEHGVTELNVQVAETNRNIAQGLVAYTAVSTDDGIGGAAPQYAGDGQTSMQYTWGGTRYNGTDPEIAPRDPVSHVLELPAPIPADAEPEVFAVISELEKDDARVFHLVIEAFSGQSTDPADFVAGEIFLIDKTLGLDEFANPSLDPTNPVVDGDFITGINVPFNERVLADLGRTTGEIDPNVMTIIDPKPGSGLGVIPITGDELDGLSDGTVQTIRLTLAAPDLHNPENQLSDEFYPPSATRAGDSGFLSSSFAQFRCDEEQFDDRALVLIEKIWQNADGEPVSRPLNLPPNFEITATSPLGSVSCTYPGDSAELFCLYFNENGDPTSPGLRVPTDGSFSVSEINLPAGFGVVEGTTGQGLTCEPVVPDEPCTHTVINRADQEPEPDPDLVLIDKVWQDSDGNPITTPDDVPASFEITANSSEGFATCTYEQGSPNLTCEYFDNNEEPVDGLLVPADGSFSVSEINLPEGFFAFSGTGEGFTCNPEGPDTSCTHRVINRANDPDLVFIEKVWQDSDGNPISPPENLSSGFEIIASSPLGSAFCFYEQGSTELTCDYRDSNNLPADGLLVPVDDTFSIDEIDLPEGFEVISGAGNNLTCGDNETTTTCTQTVINRQLPPAPVPPTVVLLEKVWRDASEAAIEPPDEVPANFEIIAESSMGTATCTYTEGSTELTCDYRDDDGAVTAGLLVPDEGTFNVVENNLPDDIEVVVISGVGNNQTCTPVEPGGTCTHTVVNQVEEPKVVVLLSFSATEQNGAVNVRWTTGAEFDTRGFHILRSTDGSRDSAEIVTAELIGATGSSTSGAAYSWTDTAVDDGVTYTYWLQEVEIGGAINIYGSTSVTPGVSLSNNNTVFLPVIIR
jgi:hypothetical protein